MPLMLTTRNARMTRKTLLNGGKKRELLTIQAPTIKALLKIKMIYLITNLLLLPRRIK